MKVTIPRQDDGDEKILETFKLRSGSQDQFFGNIRSSVVSRLAEEWGFDGEAGTKRIVVFLNGEYYGIFDMQRGFSSENMKKRYGIEKEKNIEKYKGSERDVFEKFGIQEDIWENLDNDENRERLEGIIDMDDYLKFYAIQIILNNTDWPMNNYEAWRFKGVKEPNNRFNDGKIRFLIYDTDLVYYTDENTEFFEGSIGDIFEFLMEGKFNGRDSSFAKVMEAEYYRQKFVDLLQGLVDGPFATENVLKVIDEEAGKIEHQVSLFSSEEEYEEWEKWIELMKRAVIERENTIKIDVKKYFGAEL